jgi:hypothetical protein
MGEVIHLCYRCPPVGPTFRVNLFVDYALRGVVEYRQA